MTALRLTVVTSCTGVKAGTGEPLGAADFERGEAHLARLHGERAADLRRAEQLYRGQQHLRLMGGVDAARAAGHDVALSIVSAGYGLVAGSSPLLPYERTFQGMASGERRRLARSLQLPEAVRGALAAPADLALVLLGGDYLDAVELPADLRLGAPTLVLCGASAALRLPPAERLRPLVLDEVVDTRRFGCGLVGLKGEVAGRLLSTAADEPEALAALLRSDRLLDALADRRPALAEPALF